MFPTFMGVPLALALLATASLALAHEYTEVIQNHAKNTVVGWLSDPEIINAVKTQNARNSALSQGDIDRLDQTWRTETTSSNRPLIDKVLSNSLSLFLKKKAAESNDLYTELFVMDAKGLNVGQSAVTSDYWQGDEAKWQETYLAGSGSMHIGDVEFDESTQSYQCQLSMPIVDPATNDVIGAITIGLNVELL